MTESKMELRFTISGGAVTSSEVVNIYNGLNLYSSSLVQTCGITNLSGCLNNSMLFLFYPSIESIAKFNLVKDSLDTKIPFVYVNQAVDLIPSLFGSVSTLPPLTLHLGFGDVVILSQEMLEGIPLVATIRFLLGTFIWIMFLMAMYRMGLGIHDKQQPV